MAALLALFVSGLSAAPSTYTIYKCGPGFTPAIDSNLSEWPEACFIDSLHSGDNCYAWDTTSPWTNADFQYSVYAAHDSSKVYFAIKNIRDNVLSLGHSSGCNDAFRIDLGPDVRSYNVFFNGVIWGDTDCPWFQCFRFWAGIKTARLPDTMPQVEFFLVKSILDPFGMGTFRLSVGFEDGDTPSSDCMNTIYGAIGVEYTGNKQDWNANPWDNPLYYPIFNLSDSMVIDVEKGKKVGREMRLEAYPNPFNPATLIGYRLGISEKGLLSIYTVVGAKVFFKEVRGQGRVSWNAAGMASGTYLVRLMVNAKTFEKTILLIK